jgi:hypothetical protein
MLEAKRKHCIIHFCVFYIYETNTHIPHIRGYIPDNRVCGDQMIHTVYSFFSATIGPPLAFLR